MSDASVERITSENWAGEVRARDDGLRYLVMPITSMRGDADELRAAGNLVNNLDLGLTLRPDGIMGLDSSSNYA